MEKVTQAVAEAANELGFPVLKPKQLEVVTSFLRGRDVFAVLQGFGRAFAMLVCLQHLTQYWRRRKVILL